MMDYYGSIIKSNEEIDKELIKSFRNRCHESYMKKLIVDLRKQEILNKEYSVSGWNLFHGETIHYIINIHIDTIYKLKMSEIRLKFTYCYNQLFNDTDVCKMICDRI
jgi:hypothetical protein